MTTLPPTNAGPPVRLQLSRKRGFNLQQLSRETNGLPAVRVTRPGPWGNRYTWPGCPDPVAAFRRDIVLDDRPSLAEIVKHLRGKNLACFCALDQPCHADVLLELANKPVLEAVS